MDEEKRQLFRSLGFLSSIGISMVAATCIGLYIGIYLDEWLDSKPWMTITWLGIGIAAGFRNIFILTRRTLREQNDAKNSDES